MRTQNSTSTKIPQGRAAAPTPPAPPPAPALPPVRRTAVPVLAAPWLRLPTPADPAPPTRRLGAMCGWAAGLGLVGVFIAVRAFFAFFGEVPVWYQPVVITVGVVGVALTVAAFLAVHEKKLPWQLLAGATAVLGVNMALILPTP